MERLGLLGLPNAGKSSLFNALTGGSTPVAAHPFSTTDSTVGIAQVADPRLQALAQMSKSRKVVSATVEFVDIAGLVAGASSGEGLGNRFLAGIREVDAVVAVLRAFEDDSVVGDCDPLVDLETLELELVLADAESLETQLPRRRKMARADPTLMPEVEAMDAALAVLSGGTPLYRATLSAEHLQALRSAFLLTAKPILAVVNLGEDQLSNADSFTKPVA
ncbi:MAG: GTPase, partial [Pseudonocardiaceae bacterium]